MKIIKTYFETTTSGVYKVQEQSNGVKIKFLREPSQSYLDKMSERQKIEEEKRNLEKIELEKERLIKNKMREIAIRELENEGKLELEESNTE